MAEIIITKENFENEVLCSDKPVLVDFWAAWCGPCKMIAPHVAEIADELSDSVKVGKINVDEQPELCDRFGIESIPTLIVFKDGKPAAKNIGYVNKAQIQAMLGL